MILARDPICKICNIEPSKDVDHIIPKSHGGDDSIENLQGLCHSCHSRKTINEGATKTAITIVCGPPGSGKNTYVKQRVKWGDLIVDLDSIYKAISGLDWYEKPKVLLPFALEAKNAIINRLKKKNLLRHAWIITTAAKAKEREQLSKKLNAEVVVIETSVNECLRRISQDNRRSGDKWKLWEPIVKRWWKSYTPYDGETIIKS